MLSRGLQPCQAGAAHECLAYAYSGSGLHCCSDSMSGCGSQYTYNGSRTACNHVRMTQPLLEKVFPVNTTKTVSWFLIELRAVMHWAAVHHSSCWNSVLALGVPIESSSSHMAVGLLRLWLVKGGGAPKGGCGPADSTEVRQWLEGRYWPSSCHVVICAPHTLYICAVHNMTWNDAHTHEFTLGRCS